jgi:hypothetical protein
MLRPGYVTDCLQSKFVDPSTDDRIGRYLDIIDAELFHILDIASPNRTEIVGRRCDAKWRHANFKQPQKLVMTVLAAGNRDNTIIIGLILGAIFFNNPQKFFPTQIPIDLGAMLKIQTGIAYAMVVEP